MKYTGGCHCGSVRYEVDMNLESAMSCNCSICSKKGHLLAFAPESSFKLLKGDGNLQDYQFNKKIIHHLFCKTCGVSSFGKGIMPDGTPTVGINIRCLDGIDLKALKIIEFDGKSLD